MAVICPAVLAKDAHEYREQMELFAPFATRIQIDLADGNFTSVKTLDLDYVWWPVGVKADLHLMYKEPARYISTVIKLKPHLVIIHAEAEGSFWELASYLHHHKIKIGVALLPQTKVQNLAPAIGIIDHVLIFSGHLGHYGGHANLAYLGKVGEIKALKSSIEIGWDGGINLENIKTLVHNGVDVLNVGGFIQHSKDPLEAYQKLQARLK